MNTPTPRPAQAPIADWATLIAKADALGLLSSTPPDGTDDSETTTEGNTTSADTCTSSTRTPR